jgi:uncharacterized protein (DUF2235 family)
VPRNIILLSDGTGNSAGKLFKTNVWRLYQALDLSSASQIAYYDDGVGASSVKPLAVIGGAFGWGLKRNVLDLYTFLCRNYADGDRIHGFGFSRGAFTIRVLIQFVLSQGLVTNFASNDELRRKARFLYREFRRGRTTRLGVATAARWVRDLVLRRFQPDEIKTVDVKAICFLGLWDTVDAYGLPIEELKSGIDRYLWPLALEDRDLDNRIAKACHALSIDDQRTTFHPLLWDERDSARFAIKDRTDDEVLTQVWFAGVHANVGGGYPDDGLSSVSLKWMIGEAKKRGLRFGDTAVKIIEASEAPYGRLYDSRARLAAYYRYDPRRLDPPRDKQGAEIPHPKIHESVIWRMAVGTDAYAPLSLPQQLRVVADPQPGDADEQRRAAVGADVVAQPPARNIHTFENYRAAAIAEGSRFFSATDQGRQMTNELGDLKPPDVGTVDLIWDTVWWRRVAYFSAVMVTTFLVLYPFLPDAATFYTHERITGFQDLAIVPATLLADILSGLVPGITKPWIVDPPGRRRLGRFGLRHRAPLPEQAPGRWPHVQDRSLPGGNRNLHAGCFGGDRRRCREKLLWGTVHLSRGHSCGQHHLALFPAEAGAGSTSRKIRDARIRPLGGAQAANIRSDNSPSRLYGQGFRAGRVRPCAALACRRRREPPLFCRRERGRLDMRIH